MEGTLPVGRGIRGGNISQSPCGPGEALMAPSSVDFPLLYSGMVARLTEQNTLHLNGEGVVIRRGNRRQYKDDYAHLTQAGACHHAGVNNAYVALQARYVP